MELLNPALLAAGALVFLSVLAGLYSARAGLSFLLVFLVVGMLAGEDGPGGLRFDDVRLSLWVGSVALAVILLDGGLRTKLSTFRTGLVPATGLATLGVLFTAALTGLAAAWAFGLPPLLALLVGAIVGSTDAAAVFSLLKTSGLRINERLASTLEIESGLNDPMAVFLVLALIAAILQPETAGVGSALGLLALQMGLGLVLGVGFGVGLAAVLNRLPLTAAAEGLQALLLMAAGVAVFGGVGWLGGSGFLAVYLFGLTVAHRAPAVVERTLAAMDGFAWLAQALMFLLLGLLVTPHQIVADLPGALAVAAALTFVARPLAVALCLVPLRFSWREIAYVSWVGLRGAVPVVLALFPLMAGVPQATLMFEIAFVVVLVSLLVQGTTLVPVARLLGLNLPDTAQDEPAARAVYGDFALDAQAQAQQACQFYGLPPPEGAFTLAQWAREMLGRAPVVGDTWLWHGAGFAVRDMRDGDIVRIGLRLAPPTAPGEPPP